MKRNLVALACTGWLLSAPAGATTAPGNDKKAGNDQKADQKADSVVMKSMEKELSRSFQKLKNAGSAPVHYLAYRIYDDQAIAMSASFGALEEIPELQHKRQLNVELRVGSPDLDSTHRSRSNMGYTPWQDFTSVPIENDESAIRAALWNETDLSFKAAQKAFTEAKTNRDVLAAEEDQSADFSKEKPQKFLGNSETLTLDKALWKERIRRASAIFKRFAKITNSSVTLNAHKIRRFMVTSEGTRIEDETVQYSLFTLASATADDGMRVWLYDHAESPNLKDLPDQKKLDQMVENLAKNVEALRLAKVAEPFAGPVILRSKAAGVFFHEVFGHRAEGHRQKDEDEGRTFSKMVGKRIMPAFISVVDDPTCRTLGGLPLNGFYRFDDEGVPASKVVLVDHGVLKTFLLGRSPIKNFDTSNGHGRSSPGSDPVARQANLIVQSDKQVPYSQLRQMLIAEVKKEGKPYGLIFDEIAGGFTITQAWMPQVFKLLPLRVYRVFPDGKPDELLRGVSIIGTPLISLETIMAAASDCDTFNGNCGAESGWVPVSASSPSLLLKTLEIERQLKDQSKPPILPPPPPQGN